MPTLISVRDAKNRHLGSCSARCYNAISGRSYCVCGGINHGVGLRVAAAQTLHIARVWLFGKWLPVTSDEIIIWTNPRLLTLAEQQTFAWADPPHVQVQADLRKSHRPNPPDDPW